MRLIDADKLPVVTEWCVDEAGFGASFHVVHEEDINNAPTIDPESLRPQGEWIDKMVRDWHCSECGKSVPKQVCFDGYCYDDKLKYCPNCGAKMYIYEDIKR